MRAVTLRHVHAYVQELKRMKDAEAFFDRKDWFREDAVHSHRSSKNLCCLMLVQGSSGVGCQHCGARGSLLDFASAVKLVPAPALSAASVNCAHSCAIVKFGFPHSISGHGGRYAARAT